MAATALDPSPTRRLVADLTPRAVPALGSAARYSRFVGLMKLLLPLLAVALVGLVVAWPDSHSRRSDPPLTFSKVDSPEANQSGMERVRYVGLDKENRPFLITASSVTPETRDGQTFILADLQADMTLRDGSWMTLMSAAGRFDRRAGTLRLDGEVGLFADNGFEIHAPSAEMNVSQGSAKGPGPVQGQGPFGQIQANGFELADRGRRLLFTGGVKLTVRQQVQRG